MASILGGKAQTISMGQLHKPSQLYRCSHMRERRKHRTRKMLPVKLLDPGEVSRNFQKRWQAHVH